MYPMRSRFHLRRRAPSTLAKQLPPFPLPSLPTRFLVHERASPSKLRHFPTPELNFPPNRAPPKNAPTPLHLLRLPPDLRLFLSPRNPLGSGQVHHQPASPQQAHPQLPRTPPLHGRRVHQPPERRQRPAPNRRRTMTMIRIRARGSVPSTTAERLSTVWMCWISI